MAMDKPDMGNAEDPIIKVEIRLNRSTWRAANALSVIREIPVCKLFEDAALVEVAKHPLSSSISNSTK